MQYKDKNGNTQTTLYHKPTDEKAFLHANSGHLRSLNNSTLCTQALILKTTHSTTTEYGKNCASTKQKFLESKCKKEVMHEQIKKVDRTEGKELFTNKENSNKTRIPLSITYNRTLPFFSEKFLRKICVDKTEIPRPGAGQNHLYAVHK